MVVVSVRPARRHWREEFIMAALRHRTFVGPTWYTHGATLNENREVIRAQAEAFVNTLGLAQVVSVSEHAMSWGPFSVVVWYRSESPVEESTVVHVSNATIGQALHREAPRPVRSELPAGGWVWLIVLLAILAVMAIINLG
jgi:hypothetical protein